MRRMVGGLRHLEVVVAVIIWGDRVLCLQRGDSHLPYAAFKFEFPGGKVEPGESRTGALSRELEEELGLVVSFSDSDFFMSVDHVYPDFSVSVHAFLCYLVDPVLDFRVHVSYRWVLFSELGGLDWVMADRSLVDALIELGWKRMGGLVGS